MKKIFTTLLMTVVISLLSSFSANALDQIQFKSLTLGGKNLLAGKTDLASVTSGAYIDAEIEPIEGAVMLRFEIRDAQGELVRSIFQATGTASTGKYNARLYGKVVTKFYDNQTYYMTVTACNTANLPSTNMESCYLAQSVVEFSGATPGYTYSDVQFVSVTPASGFEVTDVNQTIVVTFSAPVETVTSKCTQGGQGASFLNNTNITSNEDKTVWTITPGSSVWSKNAPEWTFFIAAKDAEGKVVKGNHGADAASDYTVVYDCYISRPAVTITPESGTLEKIYEFTVTESRGIGFAYNATPYLEDEEGNTVAKADLDSQVQYDSKGAVISPDVVADVTAVKMTFHLDKEIITPGTYKFIVPSASFAIGSEKNADFNRRQEYVYTIKDTEVGIESLDAENVQPVYYDLNGRRVLEPAHGIFVKVQGEKVSKIVVK